MELRNCELEIMTCLSRDVDELLHTLNCVSFLLKRELDKNLPKWLKLLFDKEEKVPSKIKLRF